MNCYYCGVSSDTTRIVRDHFIPKAKGGSDSHKNLVPACDACNRSKTDDLLEQARHRLLQRRVGWPLFNPKQLDWLRAAGFDMRPLDNAKLYFEECDDPASFPVRRTYRQALAKLLKPNKRRERIKKHLHILAFDEASGRLHDCAYPQRRHNRATRVNAVSS
jgi:hypothetical protein